MTPTFSGPDLRQDSVTRAAVAALQDQVRRKHIDPATAAHNMFEWGMEYAAVRRVLKVAQCRPAPSPRASDAH